MIEVREGWEDLRFRDIVNVPSLAYHRLPGWCISDIDFTSYKEDLAATVFVELIEEAIEVVGFAEALVTGQGYPLF